MGSSRFTRGRNSARTGSGALMSVASTMSSFRMVARTSRLPPGRTGPKLAGQRMRHGTDGTGAHGQQHVAGLEHGLERLVQRLDLFHEHGLYLAARADGTADRAAVGGGDGRFTGRVHL